MRANFVALLISAASAISLVGVLTAQPAPADHVSVVPNEPERRVDISIDGQPFTSYIWPTALKKPVLYPLRTANGTIITRGFPLDPRPGERTDHPHHAGLWFNHEDVNGFDFWNNSDAIKPERAPKMGTILQRRIVSAKSGADRGDLEVETDWVTFEKKVLLNEHTHFVFRGGRGFRSLDRLTTLTALDEKVSFRDAKDGMLGLRVIRAPEIPPTSPKVTPAETATPPQSPKLTKTALNVTNPLAGGKRATMPGVL